MLLVLFSAACEIEKTEYERFPEELSFHGFSGNFILHNQSISYYSPEVNKIYPNIYSYQNGQPIGNGIHSFYVGKFSGPGLITYQIDSKVEFIDMVHLLSEGVLELENPRNIFDLRGHLLVSFGDNNTGGIAIIDDNERKIAKALNTGIEAGKVYRNRDENYLYVFSNGYLVSDSIIEKFYYEQGSPASLHKLDSFIIGVRPVDFVEMSIYYDDYSHAGLAILCKGDEIHPASIVLFDMITEEVAHSYPFASTSILPENLFWIPFYHSWEYEDPSRKVLASYANDNLFSLNLSNPVEMSVLINRNISELLLVDEYLLGVLRDTSGTESYLYRFDRTTLNLVDSVSIPPRALKLVK